MIRFLSVFFVAAFLIVPAAFSATQNASAIAPPARFFSEMQDIPLIPGLNELTDQTVTFDKPEGRIVESVAEIESGNTVSVKKAYEETLPQLGWTKISDNSYTRESESLTLNFESYNGRNFVRILVRPKDRIVN
jgi:hypothetical protein